MPAEDEHHTGACNPNGYGIFTMPDLIDCRTLAVMLLGIIVISLAFETVLHRLHRAATVQQRMLLDKLKDELMLMGLVSFLLVITAELMEITHEDHLHFEWAHLLLFMFALVMMVSTALCMFAENSIRLAWEAQDATDAFVQGERGARVRALSQSLQRERTSGGYFRRLLWSFGLKSENATEAEYRCAKRRFFLEHPKVKRSSFSFVSYLSLQMVQNVSRLLDINLYTWAMLGVLVLVNLARFEIDDAVQGYSTEHHDLPHNASSHDGGGSAHRRLNNIVLHGEFCEMIEKYPHILRSDLICFTVYGALLFCLDVALMWWGRRKKLHYISGGRIELECLERGLAPKAFATDAEGPTRAYESVSVALPPGSDGEEQTTGSGDEEVSVADASTNAIREEDGDAHSDSRRGKTPIYEVCVRSVFVLHCLHTALFLQAYVYRLYLASVTRFDGRGAEFSPFEAALIGLFMLVPQLLYFGPIKTKHIEELSMFDVLRVVDHSVFDSTVREAACIALQYESMRASFMVLNGFRSTIEMKRSTPRLAEIFHKYDADNNGELNKAEFRRFLRDRKVMGKSALLTEERVVELMRTIAFYEARKVGRERHLSVHSVQRRIKGSSRRKPPPVTFEGFCAFLLGGLEDSYSNVSEAEAHADAESERQPGETNGRVGPESGGRLGSNLHGVAQISDDRMHRYVRKEDDVRMAQVFAFKTKDKCSFEYGPALPGDYVVVRAVPVPGTDGRYDIYGVKQSFFECNYENVPGGAQGASLYRKKGHIFAQRMAENFEVAVSEEPDEDGGKAGAKVSDKVKLLRGMRGDFIVRPVGDEPYVVTAARFEQIYELDEDQHWKTLRSVLGRIDRDKPDTQALLRSAPPPPTTTTPEIELEGLAGLTRRGSRESPNKGYAPLYTTPT